MTIPSTSRKAGPLLGTGAQTAWPFTFKVFAASDIAVTIADSLGIETALVLDTDYSVTLNANQETSPGGTVTYPISGTPLAVGSKLSIIGDLDYDQPLDLPSGGNFSPLALENQLDRMTMQLQQLEERLSRALLVPVNSTADVQLPNPEANELIGWDSTGDNLANYALSELATGIAYGTMRFDTFVGDGTTTQFALTEDPAALANLDVSLAGVTQVPGTDYTLTSATLVFTTAPVNGVAILARYGRALPIVGPVDSSAVTHVASGAGAVATTVQEKLRESVSVLDFGAVGNGTTDDTAAFDNAIAYASTNKLTVFAPTGTYYVDRVDLRSDVTLRGESGTVLKRKGNIIVGVSYDGVSVDNASVESISFDNNAPGPAAIWKYCVYIANSTNITFRNCKFYNGYDIAIKDLGPDGIYISTGGSGRNNILIEDCTFEQFTRNGISVTNGVNELTVRGCTFEDCGLFGMDVESDFGNAIYARNITVDNCRFINNGNYALRAEVTVTGGLNFVAPNPVTSYHNLNTRVSGCYFKTNSATNATGISYLSISSTYNMIVTDCIFDVPDTASPHWVMFDTGAYESDNGIVSNNVFRVRVESYTFNNLKFHGNTLNGSLAYLLMASQGTGKLVSDNNFVDSGDNTHPPIQAYSLDLNIVGNNFRDSRSLGVAPATVLQIAGSAAGTALFTIDALIANNHVYGAYGAFVDMTGGSSAYGLDSVKFSGNVITDTQYGIRLNSSAARPNSFRIDIENNTFDGTTATALYLSRVSGLKITGNSFYNCSTNTNVMLLSECGSYLVNGNIIRDTRSGAARATYAINASGSVSPSALLSSNLSLNTQSGFTIAAGEGTVANNTTY